jgi:hypothetical protein
MQWLEMIKVRTAGNGEQAIDKALLDQIAGLLKSPDLTHVRSYVHASVTNDLLITLTWYTEEPQPWGSDLGHSLSQELKRYGLVDHSVWLETF